MGRKLFERWGNATHQTIPPLSEFDQLPDELIINSIFASRKNNYFINFKRLKNPEEQKESIGGPRTSKLHLSVDLDQVEKTWDLIAPLLISAESPFNNFKIRNLSNATSILELPEETGFSKAKIENWRRLTIGGQLTIYLPGSNLDIQLLDKITNFLVKIEQILKENNINPGIIPDSDRQFTTSTYFSGRVDHDEEDNYLSAKDYPVEEIQKLNWVDNVLTSIDIDLILKQNESINPNSVINNSPLTPRSDNDIEMQEPPATPKTPDFHYSPDNSFFPKTPEYEDDTEDKLKNNGNCFN